MKHKRVEKIKGSKFMESTILGVSGLIAITLGGFAVYLIGIIFHLEYFSIPFMEELLLGVEYPLFFIVTALIKMLIGGKIIELSVKYISRLLGIKKIIIAPGKPLIIVRDRMVKSPISPIMRLIGVSERRKINLKIAEKAVVRERAERSREKNRNVALGICALLIIVGFPYFFAVTSNVILNFVVSLIVSALVIYAATKLLGEKEGLGTAVLAALVGAILFTGTYFFFGTGLFAAIIGGVAWLIALKSLYSMGWLKSLLIAVVVWVMVSVLSFLPSVAGSL